MWLSYLVDEDWRYGVHSHAVWRLGYEVGIILLHPKQIEVTPVLYQPKHACRVS